MNMAYCVQIGDPLNDTQIVEIESIIVATFLEIHKIYNNWNPHSEVSYLNALEANTKVIISSELASFLQKLDQIVTLSEGRFDPTVGSIQKLWKKSLQTHHLPSQETLDRLNPSIGWKKIHLEENAFWKDNSLTEIDLGGIAKGYAVDLITERLLAQGYAHLYVEWGGEIRAHGQHPEGRLWKVGIDLGRIQQLENEAIATSGSYMQNWTVEGLCYTHIVDPRSGIALHDSPILSASVLAPSCLEADGLATALMLFKSVEEAESWTQKHEIKAYFNQNLTKNPVK